MFYYVIWAGLCCSLTYSSQQQPDWFVPNVSWPFQISLLWKWMENQKQAVKIALRIQNSSFVFCPGALFWYSVLSRRVSTMDRCSVGKKLCPPPQRRLDVDSHGPIYTHRKKLKRSSGSSTRNSTKHWINCCCFMILTKRHILLLILPLLCPYIFFRQFSQEFLSHLLWTGISHCLR